MKEMNRKQARRNSSRTAPAQRELTVGTLFDVFHLKGEVDAAYRDHVRTLEVIVTVYNDPECGMLLKDDVLAYITHWVEMRGYELFKDECLLGHFSARRVIKLSFTARVGLFPSWPVEPKEDES